MLLNNSVNNVAAFVVMVVVDSGVVNLLQRGRSRFDVFDCLVFLVCCGFLSALFPVSQVQDGEREKKEKRAGRDGQVKDGSFFFNDHLSG